MQHQILINVIIFVAYVLNLPLNTQRSHSRSQRAGKWSLILAHDRRPIYRAPTYIAVPLLGPHQLRYIGLTLYYEVVGLTAFHICMSVGLSDWLPWSCHADCLTPEQTKCCPVHMTHYSTMTTTAPVLRNRSREWFSQQASGPLQINWRPRRDLFKSCQERLKDVGRASKWV